ncbi:competence protein [Rhizobium ruizarguesonis]|uniref:ComEC/Rec2 family competence protein n=1 Tax=Rhizobium ruizarguesonis TaxID=2081791 RepID=UPI00102FFADB|nr:competence protein [Rhizobium ruizarguesonis]TAW04065.1 competence protein [Rhizobium ruizarguesonis]
MKYLDDDIVNLRRHDGGEAQYYWGDACEVLSQDDGRLEVRIIGKRGVVDTGYIDPHTNLRSKGLIRLSTVDVQQGDGLIMETPEGKVIFIDGGDNQLFARHANFRYPNTSEQDPLVVDLMLITHGDADHFDGLTELRKSETDTRPGKRIFVAPQRVYHNGIVKRPGKAADDRDRKDSEMFGRTMEDAGEPYVVDLVDDQAAVPRSEMNSPFKTWVGTLEAWEPLTLAATGQSILHRRLDHTKTDAFDFLLDEDIHVELLGPITETVQGQTGLRFLRDPPDDANLMLGSVAPDGQGSLSASHTINGHSINFRLRFGNVRFLFTGDLNQEAGQRLRQALPAAAIRAEILKAPHHGSADFDMEFLKEVSPVVSLISSADESKRMTPSIIFCTELAAFFSVLGYVDNPKKPGTKVFAFERTNFGISHVRTDGERVLAFTHSGKEFLNEAYRFTVSPTGDVAFAKKVVKRNAPRL